MKKIFLFIIALSIGGGLGLLTLLNHKLRIQQTLFQNHLATLTLDYQLLNRKYKNLSYESHLASLNTFAIEQSKEEIEQEYEKLKSEASYEKLTTIEKVFSEYNTALEKIARNKKEGLNTTNTQNQIPDWGQQFLDQKFDELYTAISEENQKLDEGYQQLLAQRAEEKRRQQLTKAAQPTSAPPPSLPSQLTKGYGQLNVKTEKGAFTAYVIKFPLNVIRILTVTANKNDCQNNCPTKTLQQYVSENNGFAGIHGTYFCPTDYSTCANKTNSYDFAVYNSASGKWLNANSLGWKNMGLLTFVETQLKLENFHQFEPNYAAPSVTAGIQNYPSLVSNNNIVVDNFTLTSYQRTKGYRGAIGFNNNTLFLAIVRSSTVPEAAYVMKALGATNALNLDGGGSSAMYYQGSYKVGPGRSLPNAIVLQNR